MTLSSVTVTGADDAVDPRALAALSREFPFVEWGILVSASRVGTPRYPTRRWMLHMEGVAVAGCSSWPAASDWAAVIGGGR